MKMNPLRRAATNRVLYVTHKNDAHNGKTSFTCPECAAYENETTPGKLRRDSE